MNWIEKKEKLYFLILMLTLIIVELILIFTVPLVIKDIRSKSNEIFLGVTTRNHHKLGWIAYNGRPRPSTNYAVRNSTKDPCVYVFGDSFSHADEVNHVDAWPNQLEKKLGCKVINHGVNAYGTDQAYLLLADVLPNRDQSSGKANIIVLIVKLTLGLFVVMGLIFFLNKIDFPSPKKNIEKVISNENFKIVK